METKTNITDAFNAHFDAKAAIPSPSIPVKEGQDELFTGGEWVKIKTNDGWAIKEKGLLERGYSDRIAEVNHYPESEANADIICAAPAMYRALKKCLDDYETYWDAADENSSTFMMIGMLKSILQKATSNNQPL